MKVQIQDLKFQTIIGILDFERVNPQDVIVNLWLKYDYKNDFINYADVSELIKQSMQVEEFLLIEDALLFLITKLKKEFTKITSLELKITKPSILPNCCVSVSEFKEFNS